MKFYGRDAEITELRKIRARAAETSRLTVVTGRRRVGKSILI